MNVAELHTWAIGDVTGGEQGQTSTDDEMHVLVPSPKRRSVVSVEAGALLQQSL